MKTLLPTRLMQWLGPCLFALILGFSCNAHAKTTGVPVDHALQSGPCYETLTVRNLTEHVGAPDREIGAACQAENGDIDKAWARTLRLWGPSTDTLPDYGTYAAPAAPVASLLLKSFAIIVMLLVYAFFGTPLRAVASLMGGTYVPLAAWEAIACLVFRGLIAVLLFCCLSFPYAPMAGAVLLTGLIWWTVKGSAPASPAGNGVPSPSPDTFSRLSANIINDVAGSTVGLLGLALLARHDFGWLAIALALAIGASAPLIIVARRGIRANHLAMTVLAASIAATASAFALADPPFAQLFDGSAFPGVVVSLIFAGIAAEITRLKFGRSLIRSRW